MADMKSKVNLIGIIGIIGAILMVVGVFLNWVDITGSALGFSKTFSYTGWEVFNEDAFGDVAYNYAPIAVLACGIIALIATILPVAYNNAKVSKILGALALVLAIVSIILMMLFRGDIVDGIDLGGIVGASVDVAYGFWIAIAGAALTIIGGIADIAKKNQ